MENTFWAVVPIGDKVLENGDCQFAKFAVSGIILIIFDIGGSDFLVSLLVPVKDR